ncbi:hypothetical protein GCM10017781_45850 [Deinococcus metalli]|uniref:Uncharacterized protein n=1 Tax=Deinococcus metalli TaxID=1141878 RepID=A0ABQ3K141_9DEIO|nr:hypothetical protein GCM10017781_45850 [Deinococcus metalli]
MIAVKPPPNATLTSCSAGRPRKATCSALVSIIVASSPFATLGGQRQCEVTGRSADGQVFPNGTCPRQTPVDLSARVSLRPLPLNRLDPALTAR